MEEEASLLEVREDSRRAIRFTWGIFIQEAKFTGYIGGPMVAVTLSMYLIQVVSTMMVGHLGELSLSSATLATSLCGVTGFSIMLGMASGLETLAGQAFGATQYRKLGVYTWSATISLTLVCVPISLLWASVGKLLTFIGQDPLISLDAGKYATCLIPALFANAALQPLIRYFQSQSLIIPMLLSMPISVCIHIPLCWVLIYKFGLGSIGAALATGISYWISVVFLGLYAVYSPSCDLTRTSLTKEAFQRCGEFLYISVPSAVMICLEWWSFEIIILLSGLLPKPQLETSVLSICLTTATLVYMIPYGLGAAVSTRVSNELGAGRPNAARLVVYSVMIIAVIELVIMSLLFFACRNIMGFAYSNEKEVVDYVTGMVPLICLTVIMDSLQGVLSGVARGCGWQHLGAYVNLGAFYLAGIPVAVLLGFRLHYGGKGLYFGILTGSFIQTATLAFIAFRTDWEYQARNATERMLQEREVPVAVGETK
ncbi:protein DETOXIFICATION 14-like [Papaver somniferum]|uniref:protein DETOXIFICATION 14-like n=1 Tax=Papaver somniferum TaxID=3469 RepID=UPI000E6FAB8F|nr:protein DETOXIFICATION 14-like [Papaver somniferum]